jgi:serine/threonine-protein kinase
MNVRAISTEFTEMEVSPFFHPPAYFPPADCRTLREVGRGGMAVVYEACDHRDERVALKVSLPSLPHPELARFHQEATIGRRLQHPGIPRIKEHGHYAGGAWITMEYVDGAPLETCVDDPRLTTSDRLDVLYAVADTLQHAHERGVIHRDVKPSNIILSPECPKLLDFGIAKITDVAMTKPDNLVGTPTHMAPEQLFGEEIDHRADIFQLGVLAHELFARGLPWDGEHPVRIAWAVCYEEPIKLSARFREELDTPREVVGELERIVSAALSRKPEDRPASAAEFRSMIQTLRKRLGIDCEIRFGAPVWNVAETLVVLGPSEISRHLPPAEELLFARTADDALGLLLRDPRRQLIVDCDALGHELVLDILDVLTSWRRGGSITLVCESSEWSGLYSLRGVRVVPRHAIDEIHEDLLAA